MFSIEQPSPVYSQLAIVIVTFLCQHHSSTTSMTGKKKSKCFVFWMAFSVNYASSHLFPSVRVDLHFCTRLYYTVPTCWRLHNLSSFTCCSPQSLCSLGHQKLSDFFRHFCFSTMLTWNGSKWREFTFFFPQRATLTEHYNIRDPVQNVGVGGCLFTLNIHGYTIRLKMLLIHV